MVARELLQLRASNAIDAAITEVANQRALRKQRHGAGRRSHGTKVAVGLPPAIDFAVCLDNCFLHRFRWGQIPVLAIQMRNAIDGDLAC